MQNFWHKNTLVIWSNWQFSSGIYRYTWLSNVSKNRNCELRMPCWWFHTSDNHPLHLVCITVLSSQTIWLNVNQAGEEGYFLLKWKMGQCNRNTGNVTCWETDTSTLIIQDSELYCGVKKCDKGIIIRYLTQVSQLISLWNSCSIIFVS